MLRFGIANRPSWAAFDPATDAAPDLVEVRHFYSGQRGWISYAPRALLEVDVAAGTGVIEIADLARSGTHHVLLRGYVRTPAGSYVRGAAALLHGAAP